MWIAEIPDNVQVLLISSNNKISLNSETMTDIEQFNQDDTFFILFDIRFIEMNDRLKLLILFSFRNRTNRKKKFLFLQINLNESECHYVFDKLGMISCQGRLYQQKFRIMIVALVINQCVNCNNSVCLSALLVWGFISQ